MTHATEAGSSRNQFVAAFVVNILGFCHGCGTGWLSPVLPLLTSEDNSPLGEPLNTGMTAIIASAICISGAIGTPIFGIAADRIGRKTSVMISAIPYEMSWLVLLFWRTQTGVLVGRFLAGCGAAGIFMLTSQYAAEISSRDTRGMLGSFMVFSINFGIIFMYTLQSMVSYCTTLVIMSFVPITAFILLWKMPETPAFLVKMGKTEEAIKALAWLRGVSEHSSLIKEELTNLKFENDLANATSKNSSSTNPAPLLEDKNDVDLDNIPAWKLIFVSKPTRRAFFTSFLLLTMQCFIGTYAIVSFASQIFTEAGTSVPPHLCTIILGVIQLTGSMFASSLIEKLGRKILLLSSSLITSTCMGVVATYLYCKQSGFDVSMVNFIPVIMLPLAVCSFSVGVGPIPYVLLSELFVVQARGMVNSILLVWVWIASFLISLLYLPCVDLVGISTVFYFFSMVAFSVGILTVFFLPETKGRPMEEIVAYFDGDKSQRISLQLDNKANKLDAC